MHLLPILPLLAAILIVADGSPMRTSGAHSAIAGELRAIEPYVGCAPGKRTSTPIPFERVDLGPAGEPQGGNDLLLGPRMLAVITDSTSWPSIWRAAADTVPVANVTFGGSVLVLVATRTYGLGRIQLRMTSPPSHARSALQAYRVSHSPMPIAPNGPEGAMVASLQSREG